MKLISPAHAHEEQPVDSGNQLAREQFMAQKETRPRCHKSHLMSSSEKGDFAALAEMRIRSVEQASGGLARAGALAAANGYKLFPSYCANRRLLSDEFFVLTYRLDSGQTQSRSRLQSGVSLKSKALRVECIRSVNQCVCGMNEATKLQQLRSINCT